MEFYEIPRKHGNSAATAKFRSSRKTVGPIHIHSDHNIQQVLPVNRVQSGIDGTRCRDPINSRPSLPSTHQQSPVLLWHCNGSKCPSSVHRGTNVPITWPDADWSIACRRCSSHTLSIVVSANKQLNIHHNTKKTSNYKYNGSHKKRAA